MFKLIENIEKRLIGKKYLSVTETVELLSDVLENNFSEADFYSAVLSGDLIFSVYFAHKVAAFQKEKNSYEEFLNLCNELFVDHPEMSSSFKKSLSKYRGDNIPDIIWVDGVWDLPLVGAARQIIQSLHNIALGIGEEKNVLLGEIVLQKGTNFIELQESCPDLLDRAEIEKQKQYIHSLQKDRNIVFESQELHEVILEEKRLVDKSYIPMSEFPAHSVFVVKSDELKKYVKILFDPERATASNNLNSSKKESAIIGVLIEILFADGVFKNQGELAEYVKNKIDVHGYSVRTINGIFSNANKCLKELIKE